MVQAANKLRASSGNSQVTNGWSVYWANVLAIIAFDIGLMMTNAAQRKRKAGNEPNACKN